MRGFVSFNSSSVIDVIKSLRPIGLRIDRVHPNMFPKNPALRARGLGIDVHAFVRLPNTRQMTQGSEIGQAVRGHVLGFGKDVCGQGQHTKTSCDRGIGDLMLTECVEFSLDHGGLVYAGWLLA